jgi:hypothetical protein
MTETTAEPPANAIPSAEDLRMRILEAQMEEFERRQKAKAEEERKLAAFSDSFLKEHISDEERAMIARIVQNALKEGKFEAMIYTFPSALCTDEGRAINSGHPDWPDTLQGKAREIYERYRDVAQPRGYRLKAMIINFPGGIPGDVGFFLNWAPESV